MQAGDYLKGKPISLRLAEDWLAFQSFFANTLSRLAVTAKVANTLITNADAIAHALACKIGK